MLHENLLMHHADGSPSEYPACFASTCACTSVALINNRPHACMPVSACSRQAVNELADVVLTAISQASAPLASVGGGEGANQTTG